MRLRLKSFVYYVMGFIVGKGITYLSPDTQSNGAMTHGLRVHETHQGHRVCVQTSCGDILHTSPPGATEVKVKNVNRNQDNTSVANMLRDKVRVLCMVMTIEHGHSWNVKYTKNTWGKRCNKLLFMSDIDDPNGPSVKIDVPSGRDHLTAKTMKSFELAYDRYSHEFEWFLKADDDTYIIVENLRYLLSSHSPNEPVFFGHHFRNSVTQGYFSGGGGYVLSKEALHRFATRTTNFCRMDYGAEDIEMGKCMESLGVRIGESRDDLGRTRFHGLQPEKLLSGAFPKWFIRLDNLNGTYGLNRMSDFTISFHYIPPSSMFTLDYFVFHLRSYGTG